MEIYKYILLIFGAYIAICRIFREKLKNMPICLDNLFDDNISFAIQCIVVFGFVFWLLDVLNKWLFPKKEGWMSISEIKQSEKENDDIDASLIPSDVEDIPEVPCPTNPNNNRSEISPRDKSEIVRLTALQKQDKLSGPDKVILADLQKKVQRINLGKKTGEKDINPETGLCHGQFADIPEGYYGFTVTTKDKYLKGAVTNEEKMRPLQSVESDCKLMTGPGGKPSVERSVEAKSPSSDSEKCVNRVNILKSQKGEKQYDANDLSEVRNKELTPNEKEDKQKSFDVNLDLVNPKPVYYEPGSYTFGASTYVPNYEQSVYLSKTTNLSQTSPIDMTVNNTGGFCAAMQNDKLGLDRKCQSLDPDVCPSTNCCVLLGGEKCFAGDESGPSNKSAFSDTTITNRDYYYYKSKCYGNCP